MQTPEETLRKRRGSCRDFAVLMMEASRSLGIAARFVSGYIFVPGSVPSICRRRRYARLDAGVFAGRGWIDFDPTNSIIGNRNLIRVAVAWAPQHALPLWGTYDGPAGAFLDMEVTVRVTEEAEPALEETEPVTEPADSGDSEDGKKVAVGPEANILVP